MGKTLKATRGSWTSGTTFSYQWLRNGKAISGAKKAQYKLTSNDRNKKISVRVTGKRSGYSTLNKVSAQTKPIKAAAKPKTSLKEQLPRGRTALPATLSRGTDQPTAQTGNTTFEAERSITSRPRKNDSRRRQRHEPQATALRSGNQWRRRRVAFLERSVLNPTFLGGTRAATE